VPSKPSSQPIWLEVLTHCNFDHAQGLSWGGPVMVNFHSIVNKSIARPNEWMVSKSLAQPACVNSGPWLCCLHSLCHPFHLFQRTHFSFSGSRTSAFSPSLSMICTVRPSGTYFVQSAFDAFWCISAFMIMK